MKEKEILEKLKAMRQKTSNEYNLRLMSRCEGKLYSKSEFPVVALLKLLGNWSFQDLDNIEYFPDYRSLVEHVFLTLSCTTTPLSERVISSSASTLSQLFKESDTFRWNFNSTAPIKIALVLIFSYLFHKKDNENIKKILDKMPRPLVWQKQEDIVADYLSILCENINNKGYEYGVSSRRFIWLYSNLPFNSNDEAFALQHLFQSQVATAIINHLHAKLSVPLGLIPSASALHDTITSEFFNRIFKEFINSENNIIKQGSLIDKILASTRLKSSFLTRLNAWLQYAFSKYPENYDFIYFMDAVLKLDLKNLVSVELLKGTGEFLKKQEKRATFLFQNRFYLNYLILKRINVEKECFEHYSPIVNYLNKSILAWSISKNRKKNKLGQDQKDKQQLSCYGMAQTSCGIIKQLVDEKSPWLAKAEIQGLIGCVIFAVLHSIRYNPKKTYGNTQRPDYSLAFISMFLELLLLVQDQVIFEEVIRVIDFDFLRLVVGSNFVNHKEMDPLALCFDLLLKLNQLADFLNVSKNKVFDDWIKAQDILLDKIEPIIKNLMQDSSSGKEAFEEFNRLINDQDRMGFYGKMEAFLADNNLIRNDKGNEEVSDASAKLMHESVENLSDPPVHQDQHSKASQSNIINMDEERKVFQSVIDTICSINDLGPENNFYQNIMHVIQGQIIKNIGVIQSAEAAKDKLFFVTTFFKQLLMLNNVNVIEAIFSSTEFKNLAESDFSVAYNSKTISKEPLNYYLSWAKILCQLSEKRESGCIPCNANSLNNFAKFQNSLVSQVAEQCSRIIHDPNSENKREINNQIQSFFTENRVSSELQEKIKATYLVKSQPEKANEELKSILKKSNSSSKRNSVFSVRFTPAHQPSGISRRSN